MKELTIDPDTARKAKDAGFTWACYTYYNNDNRLIREKRSRDFNAIQFANGRHFDKADYKSAPTQEMLHRWLREKHDVWITISFGYKVEWNVWKKKRGPALIWNMENPTRRDGLCNTYEEAMEEGLKQSLELLKLEYPWD